MTTDTRQRAKALLDRQIMRCHKCDGLNEPGVTEAAPGFGSLYSPVAIVGEALCRKCMEKREPFVGGSGLILEKSIMRAGYEKADLFITNSIHCHPPGDRDPKREESKNCAGFLRKELREIVQPRLVIGVGAYAKAALAKLYDAEARELNWPFRVPRARRSDPLGLPYLLFPPHPRSIMFEAKPIREDYARRLARAIEWGFATASKQVDR